MNYDKTTAYTRYGLDVDAARKDLKHHGFDFDLAVKISEEINSISKKFDDTPELALALIVSGWNAKCMAEMDQDFVYSTDDKNSESYKIGKLFQVVDALAKKHEDDLFEVIYQWKE